MLKLLDKVAEKNAKTTNTACLVIGVFHQPKMPAYLIKKEQSCVQNENIQKLRIKNKMISKYKYFLIQI